MQSFGAHPHFTGSQILETGDDAQQSRLSRSAFAENRQEFTFRYLERNIPQDDIPTEALRHIPDRKQS
jgi:hypothetical protein